jgi:hypothetical protein
MEQDEKINIDECIKGECGDVVTWADWNRIELLEPEIHYWLKDANNTCFTAVIVLKMFISDITIVYGAIDMDDEDSSKGKTAHAIVRKGDWVYDNNFKKHVLYEKYIKLFDMDVYAELPGPDFENYKEYTEIVLKGGYRNWCNENGYELLI